jgi:hypothetical protein
MACHTRVHFRHDCWSSGMGKMSIDVVVKVFKVRINFRGDAVLPRFAGSGETLDSEA